MTDRLTEAYRLLGNDIPPGLGYVGYRDGRVEWYYGPKAEPIPEAVAEWGLIVAVEGVLLDAAWTFGKVGDRYDWWCPRHSIEPHPDRLTAATLALKAERSKP